LKLWSDNHRKHQQKTPQIPKKNTHHTNHTTKKQTQNNKTFWHLTSIVWQAIHIQTLRMTYKFVTSQGTWTLGATSTWDLPDMVRMAGKPTPEVAGLMISIHAY